MFADYSRMAWFQWQTQLQITIRGLEILISSELLANFSKLDLRVTTPSCLAQF